MDPVTNLRRFIAEERELGQRGEAYLDDFTLTAIEALLPNENSLSISFDGVASETFRNIVTRMDGYCVRLTPLDGSEPFDAVVMGSTPIGGEDLHDYRQVWFLRADEDGLPLDGATPETLLVRDVYVY